MDWQTIVALAIVAAAAAAMLPRGLRFLRGAPGSCGRCQGCGHDLPNKMVTKPLVPLEKISRKPE